MISVPNPLRLLNGNRLLVLFLFLAILFGCASSSRVGSSRTPKVLEPILDKEENPTNIVHLDSVQLEWVSSDVFPPVTDESPRLDSHGPAVLGAGRKLKDSYTLALFLPLILQDAGQANSLDANNLKFAHFYAGIQLAANSITDLPVRIKVYNTNRDPVRTQEIIDQLQRDIPDVIIGPYENESLSILADFAKKYEIIMISPWKSSSRITNENYFYVQMRPNITRYYESILEHATYQFDRNDICIIGRAGSEDEGKFDVLQDLNEKLGDVPLIQALKTIRVKNQHLYESDSLLFSPLVDKGVKAFIIPHYSSRDESFVYSCLRKLSGEKGEREFYVYTMPLVLNSEKVDLNILKNLNIRICEFRFPDTRDPQIKSFRKNYYESFGWLPTEDAYYGFDLMQFIAYGLKNYGMYFPWELIGKKLDFSQMSVSIIADREGNNSGVNYLTNNQLYFIEFNVDHFEVKNIR